MNNLITRQHTETDIYEMVGTTCNRFLAVSGEVSDSVVIFYISLGNLWLRGFLDEKVLFIDVCDGPDPDDDLDDNEEYLDLGEKYALKDRKITKASIKEGAFELYFDCGTKLVFEQLGDITKLYSERINLQGV
jgi:hypothetical protein